MENESRFQSFYFSQLESELTPFDIDRKKIVRKTFITLFAFIAALFLIIIIFSNEPDMAVPIVTIAFIVLLITFFILK
jgi:fatty acid desaturase